MTVTPKQLSELLTAMIPARLPLLITGAPGIGKTDIVTESAQLANADFIVTHPVVEDPTDRKGIPWPDAASQSCLWLTDHTTKQLCSTDKLTVWLMDDLGQASPSVQASHMQWLLNRGVNGHKLSPFVTMVAATNRRTDRAGVSGILEPVKSRFACIVELEPTIDEWSQWAYAHNVSPTLIAFLRYRPELLCAFQSTADLTNSPVPRTWAHLAKLETLNLPQTIEAAAFSGAVGEGASLEYLAFRQMAKSLVNLDAILLNPDKAAIPSKPSELYATAVGLAARANDTNFARIATYATRLYTEADKGEFSVLLIRDAVRRDEKIQYTDAFVRMNSGPVGQLISGRD